MQWFLNLPVEIRIAAVWIFATIFIGPFVNWAIYALSYFGLPTSPWQAEMRRHTDQSWLAKIPVVGWWFVRTSLVKDRGVPKTWIWLRPLLLEILVPFAVAGLYWWESTGHLLPPIAAAAGRLVTPADLHWQLLGHELLLMLLTIATFIDFDEMMIPDSVTVPGTLLALIGSVLITQWRLWIDWIGPDERWPSQLLFSSPGEWPAWGHSIESLILALSIFAAWCFALADRRIILRRGFRRAISYFFAGLVRRGNWKFLISLWIVGWLSITLSYLLCSPVAWQSLLSCLMGLAIGGVLVWSVRIVAGVALGVEALGFGDVVLMAMVGAFLGWQPVVIAFFLAPFFALAIVLVVALITGKTSLPFGPYLCAATIYVLVRWDVIWNQWLQDLFGLGWQIGVILLGMFALMGAMLAVWRVIKIRLFYKDQP